MCRPTCDLWSSAVLSRALADAERDGLVTRNVARLVEAPSAGQTEAGALTLDDARRVIAADEDGRWAMGLLTGARRGEVVGLKWDRLDLREGFADLAWQLQRLPWAHGCPEDSPCGRRTASGAAWTSTRASRSGRSPAWP